MNHASDCAFWADEPCDCITGKPDDYDKDAAALIAQTESILDVLQTLGGK